MFCRIGEENYVKADNRLINQRSIRWVEHEKGCIFICSKKEGCQKFNGTFEVCKGSDDYERLLKTFMLDTK